MANETDPIATTVHGTDPQNLIEKIVRDKIHECRYWKEECFGLSAEALVDKAVELNHVGGTFGGSLQPCPFLCLAAKMLQIQPDKDIVIEFIKNEDYKYVRLLGAFYLRLSGKATEIYQYLEPLFNDYRKIRMRLQDGGFALSHVDEIVDSMLQKDHLFDISLPRIPLRIMLERSGALEPRVSVLAEEFEEVEEELKQEEEEPDLDQQKRREEKERKKVLNENKERVRMRRHRSRSPKAEYSKADDTRKSPRHRSKSPKKKDKSKKMDPEGDEIAEANALRAKLGLKPLK